MLELSISIVATDERESLIKCLDSLFNNAPASMDFDVHVVDNMNNISDHVKEKHPEVKLIKNKRRMGFAENHNNVIRQSSGNNVLIMNPDVFIKKGFFAELLRVMEADSSAGIVTPKLLMPDGRTFDSTGHIIYKSRRTVDRGQGKEDRGLYDKTEEVFSACGAAMLCRREMLEDVKLMGEYFDESFQLYKEDLDLSWRARLRGWKVMYAPDATAIHLRGWSPDKPRNKVPLWIRRESFKNRYLTMIKNDHLINVLRDLPFILWHEIKALVYVIFREPHLFLAWPQIVMQLPKTLRKRAEIMKRATVGAEQIRKWFV